ncbi:MAG: type 4a pilus biogenesis protein PilO [Elusimicrobia bacterium]|nr:type 4a pilus biogenesis protein PilO [Elusimicrobiota bacterium]
MANLNINLSKEQQKVFAIGGVMLIATSVVYYKFFWSPYSKKIVEAQKQNEEIEAKIEKAKFQASRLPQLEATLNRLNEQAQEAEKRLPKKKSVPEILVTVSDLAEKARVSLISFAPGGNSNKQFFTELFYPVQVKGAYHSIGRFLAALALEERIFNIQNVTYSEPAPETGEMTVNFMLISYQYKG